MQVHPPEIRPYLRRYYAARLRSGFADRVATPRVVRAREKTARESVCFFAQASIRGLPSRKAFETFHFRWERRRGAGASESRRWSREVLTDADLKDQRDAKRP